MYSQLETLVFCRTAMKLPELMHHHLCSTELPGADNPRSHRLSQFHKGLMDNSILTSSRLHASLYDRARRFLETPRRVREARRQDDWSLSERPVLARQVDCRYQRDLEHEPPVPHHRRPRQKSGVLVRHAGCTGYGEYRSEGHCLYDTECVCDRSSKESQAYHDVSCELWAKHVGGVEGD